MTQNLTAKPKHRVLKGILIAIGVLVVGGAIAVGRYCYDNLHYDKGMMDATWAAGFEEKQITLANGAIINYAEGPDNGSPLLLIHGQQVAWEDYESVLPELAKNHHVFAIDCFGHGQSSHDASLYSCAAGGQAIVEFIERTIGEPVIISGHSSGGILAAWVAANAPQYVRGAVLEDPPLFEVTPEEMQEGASCWVWHDSFLNIHGFLNQTEVSDWPVYYAQHSYLFGKFGNLQPTIVSMMESWRTEHPTGPVKLMWLPHSWIATLYYNDYYDLLFGEAFYDGTWMKGVDQQAMLQSISFPVIYLKANTHYGDDGMVYGANSDEDAALVQASIANCTTIRIESGHDIHQEHPADFIAAFSVFE